MRGGAAAESRVCPWHQVFRSPDAGTARLVVSSFCARKKRVVRDSGLATLLCAVYAATRRMRREFALPPDDFSITPPFLCRRRTAPGSGPCRAPACACKRNPAPGGGVSAIRAAPRVDFSMLLRAFSRHVALRRAAASKRGAWKKCRNAVSRRGGVAAGLLRSSHLANSFTLFTGVAPGRCRELFSANGPSRAGV